MVDSKIFMTGTSIIYFWLSVTALLLGSELNAWHMMLSIYTCDLNEYIQIVLCILVPVVIICEEWRTAKSILKFSKNLSKETNVLRCFNELHMRNQRFCHWAICSEKKAISIFLVTSLLTDLTIETRAQQFPSSHIAWNLNKLPDTDLTGLSLSVPMIA